MSQGGFVAVHKNKFNMIVSLLNSMEIDFKDEIKALILMSSLPESWDTVGLRSAVLEDLRNWKLMKT